MSLMAPAIPNPRPGMPPAISLTIPNLMNVNSGENYIQGLQKDNSLLSMLQNAIYPNVRSPLIDVRNQLEQLRTWPEGWNGYDVAAPNVNAINHALSWIKDMYQDALNESAEWREPHVTANQDGDVMLEWWNGDKALAIYISENNARYIKEWGANVVDEMEDGPAITSEQRRALWAWFIN